MKSSKDLKSVNDRLKRLEGRLTDLGAYYHALYKELREHQEGHIGKGVTEWVSHHTKEL